MKAIASIRQSPPPHWVGDGFPVRSAFGDLAFTPEVSPFLMLDFAGPAEFTPTPRRRGVGQHPHRGFETVTLVFSGDVEHRDSAGNQGTIGPGDVQWMTAAAGVLHEEWHGPELTRHGGTLEMAQLWVNLPARDKQSAPRYQALLDADIPAVALPEGAGTLRVIAGDFAGNRGPAQTFTPIQVWDLRLAAGGRAELPFAPGCTASLYVRRGEVTVNGTAALSTGGLALLARDGEGATVEAHGPAELLVLSGEPIDEPIASYGPFVMNTREEILAAIGDFQSGRFGAAAQP